jgi:indolepyruvate ferredoxin oxidoreductase alpha subunit
VPKAAEKSERSVRLLWGSEALALGLVESGLTAISCHESVKSAEVAAACEAHREGGAPRVELHISPARAIESAIAAASLGQGAAVVLPSRSFAAGAAPLHAFAERGTTAGLVVVVIEDPGCEMTPGEIDSRYLARELYMPIIEPYSPAEALQAGREAAALSQAWGQPLMLRVGVRLLDTRSLVDAGREGPPKAPKGGAPAPALASTALGAYGGEAATAARVRRLDAIASAMEGVPFNRVDLTPPTDMLVVAVGAAYGPTRDALTLIGMESAVQLVKLGTSFPLPRAMLGAAMRKAKRVLVVEEMEPYVETRLSEIANKDGIQVQVRGKIFIARGGELTPWDVADGLGRFAGISPPVDEKRVEMLERLAGQVLPPRAPALPAEHGMRIAIDGAQAFAAGRAGARLVVEAPPEWRIALSEVSPLYFGDWGEGIGVACALARHGREPVVVVTEGRGLVGGLSGLREAQAEGLPLLVVVSPEGLSADVGRALPGGRHHPLDLRALSSALGLGDAALVEAGPCDRGNLATALGRTAAPDLKGPRILTFTKAPGGAP